MEVEEEFPWRYGREGRRCPDDGRLVRREFDEVGRRACGVEELSS